MISINSNMEMIDLTHPITAKMSLYPGSSAPLISYSCTLDQNGYRDCEMQISSHLGTHVDAPAHMLADGKTVDQIPLDRFFGLAVLVDAATCAGGEISRELLEAHVEQIKCCKFVVLRTGWAAKWGTPEYNDGYPLLSLPAAEYLAGFDQLSGVALDALSPDALDSFDYPAHHALFEAEKLIVENLSDLNRLQNRMFLLNVSPLLVVGADAAPVRAAAFLKSHIL